MRVLKAHHHAGLAGGLGGLDVGGRANLGDDVAVVIDQAIHVANVVDGLLESLPHRHGATGSGQATPAHVLEQLAIPFGDHQSVDNDRFVVQLLGVHQS